MRSDADNSINCRSCSIVGCNRHNRMHRFCVNKTQSRDCIAHCRSCSRPCDVVRQLRTRIGAHDLIGYSRISVNIADARTSLLLFISIVDTTMFVLIKHDEIICISRSISESVDARPNEMRSEPTGRRSIKSIESPHSLPRCNKMCMLSD